MKGFQEFFNRETILYMVFGAATTVVNYGVFHLIYAVVLGGQGSLLANFIAWVAAVIFSFVVNKAFVFESKSWAWPVLARELSAFVAGRVASFGIEEAGLLVSEKLLRLGRFTILALGPVSLDGVAVSKLALSVIVVVLNYFFSKWFVFRTSQ